MSASVANQAAGPHPVLPDIGKPHMVKANVRSPDIAWNELIGRAIQAAVLECGWSNKEAAAKVGVDDAEFGKWLSGARRPQLDRLLSVEELRKPLAVQFWKLAGGTVRVSAEFAA
jgi:hypothetical protein